MISAQGTAISRNGVELPEVRDITVFPLSRKPIEITKLREEDASYRVGRRKIGQLSFECNALPATETMPLLDAYNTEVVDAYVLTFPDGGTWTLTGYVLDIAFQRASPDSVLRALVLLQPTGAVAFAVPSEDAEAILLETGEDLLQETGDTLLLET